MPDNEEPRTVADFLEDAPFQTELLEHDTSKCIDECADTPALAQVTFTSWQADILAAVLAMAVEFSREDDTDVTFVDDPDAGHMSLQTLLAERFRDYFMELTEVLELLEEDIAERESVAG